MQGNDHGSRQDRRTPDDLSPTERHRLLQNDRRRHLLRVVSNQSPPVSIEALADAMVEAAIVDGARRDALEIALHHVHLPKLADAGLLEYDASTNQVVWCCETVDLLES